MNVLCQLTEYPKSGYYSAFRKIVWQEQQSSVELQLQMWLNGKFRTTGSAVTEEDTTVRASWNLSYVCNNLSTLDKREIQSINTVRYLGVYLASSKTFRCAIDNAKKSFYRSCNSLFGKVGRSAVFGFWTRHGGAAENQMCTSIVIWPGSLFTHQSPDKVDGLCHFFML